MRQIGQYMINDTIDTSDIPGFSPRDKTKSPRPEAAGTLGQAQERRGEGSHREVATQTRQHQPRTYSGVWCRIVTYN